MFQSPPQPARQTAPAANQPAGAARQHPPSQAAGVSVRQAGGQASRQSSQPASSKQDSRCLQASVRHLPPTFATEAPASRPATQRASTQPASQTVRRPAGMGASRPGQAARSPNMHMEAHILDSGPPPPKYPESPPGHQYYARHYARAMRGPLFVMPWAAVFF